MNSPHQDDDLLDRYRRASESEHLTPQSGVRDAILAEAHRISVQNRAAPALSDRSRPSGNQPRWRLAAAGSCAAVLVAVLLMVPRLSQRPDIGALSSAKAVPPRASAAAHDAVSEPPARRALSRYAESADLQSSNAAPSAYAAPREASPGQPAAVPSPPAAGLKEDGDEPADTSQDAAVSAAAAQRSVSNAARSAQNYAPFLRKKTAQSASASGQADVAVPVRTTELLTAVSSANREQILAALDRGADVNQTDELGRTPLMLATQTGQIQFVQLLLQHGADPILADASGRTPVEQARLAHRADIVKLLQAAGAR